MPVNLWQLAKKETVRREDGERLSEPAENSGVPETVAESSEPGNTEQEQRQVDKIPPF